MRPAIAYGESLPVASATSRLRGRYSLPTLALVVAFGAWSDAATLFASPYAMGADGYYYVLQVNELLNSGRLYFPTQTPLILYALAGVTRLTGDPVVSAKIFGVVLHAALSLGIFAVVAGATRSRWLGVAGSALAVLSGAHLYMVVEYLKQLGALVFLIWGGWCAARALSTRGKAWAAASAAFLLAASFSHRSALALTLVFVALFGLARLVTAESAGRSRRLLAVALLLILWCAPAVVASQVLITLPNWLSTEVLTAPRWPFSSAAALEQLILLVAASVALALILLGRGRAREWAAAPAVFAFALLGLLVVVNPFLNYSEAMSLSWRLSCLAYIEVAVLVPALIWLTGCNRKAVILVAAFVLPLLIASRGHSRPFSLKPEYVAARAAHIKRLPLYRQRLGPDALVISPHGEQFAVTYALGVPSQQRLPEDGKPRAIYWLLHSTPPKFLLPSMLIITKDGAYTQTVIAADADVRRQLESLSDAEREWMLSNNPHLNELPSNRSPAQAPPEADRP